ncbi:hypothetical protein G6046_00645, partial [Bacillus amyloliquefaciens]|nr:hypothetical protein [Bacillus amyloliquefaciens]
SAAGFCTYDDHEVDNDWVGETDQEGAPPEVFLLRRAAAMQARRAERAGDRFAKLDANGDGSISRAEFDAGHAARPDRGPRAERAGHREGRRGGA